MVKGHQQKAQELSCAFLLPLPSDEPIGFGKMRAAIRERFSLPRLTPQVGNGKPPYGEDDEPIGFARGENFVFDDTFRESPFKGIGNSREKVRFLFKPKGLICNHGLPCMSLP